MTWLTKVLPTIATAIGGPLAGVAVDFVASKLNLSEKTTDSVKAAIAGATPEQLIQLKQIDVDLQKYFAELDIDIFKLETEDRDSARKREISVHDNTPKILAYGITLGFFGILVWILKHGFPIDNKDVLIYMLGSLNAAWTGAMAYYYGTTKSSNDKNKLIASAISTTGSSSGEKS